MTKKLRIALFAERVRAGHDPVLRLSAQHGHDRDHDRDQHVLLISIDGMHAVDYENCGLQHLSDPGCARQDWRELYTYYYFEAIRFVPRTGIPARTVTSFVETDQVAPTILQILALDPAALDAVRMEGTPVLPNLFEVDHD